MNDTKTVKLPQAKVPPTLRKKRFEPRLAVFLAILLIIFIGLAIFSIYQNYKRQRIAIFSPSDLKECPGGEVLTECKLGPCCCPVGALCD